MQVIKCMRQNRNCIIIIVVFILALCTINLIRLNPELSAEQQLSQRLAESQMRVQYLESMLRTRQEDLIILSQYIMQRDNDGEIGRAGKLNQGSAQRSGVNSTTATSSTTSSSLSLPTMAATVSPTTTKAANKSPGVHQLGNLLGSLSPETRQLLTNASANFLLGHNDHVGVMDRTAKANRRGVGLTISQQPSQQASLVRFPNAYHFLPHLLDDSSSLRPAYLRTKGRSDVSIVLGIPTVKREKQSYLLGTLQNLIESMNEAEQNATLIVVCIAEVETDLVLAIAHEIEGTFGAFIDNGLIDIIAPSASYYPNFDKLHITLNDTLERVKWRSKQNLDFAYLMAYAQTKGTFYVQLEDDILAKKQFITSMKKFAIMKSASVALKVPSWFILDFCQLGFIGKMLKSVDLPYLITFFQMFYNDKPVDWLLHYFVETKVCRYDKDQKHCNQEKAKYWLHYRPSLFQHIGTSSSLKGKVQKLKDKQFGLRVPSYYAHTHNPPAVVKTNIATYRNYHLKRAYRGESYFWGLLPQPGDLVEFIFERPTKLRRYLFRSGNSEHPSDRFYNTTVEACPAPAVVNATRSPILEETPLSSLYNSTQDGCLIIDSFDHMGIAEGLVDYRIGPLREIRLHVHSDSENWILLSEIDLQPAGIGMSAPAEGSDRTRSAKGVSMHKS